MRHFITIFLLGTLMSGAAAASSISVVERPADVATPSIVYFGTAEAPAPAASDMIVEPAVPRASPQSGTAAADAPVVLSTSVIALGEPAVEQGLVASIPEAEKPRPRNPHLPPMVIRGGIFGDPFTRPVEDRAAPQDAPEQTAAPQDQPPAERAVQSQEPPTPSAPPTTPTPTSRLE